MTASNTKTNTNTIGRMVMPEPNTSPTISWATPEPSSARAIATNQRDHRRFGEHKARYRSVRGTDRLQQRQLPEPRSPIDATIRLATAMAAATSVSTVIRTITACVLFSTSPCSAAT